MISMAGLETGFRLREVTELPTSIKLLTERLTNLISDRCHASMLRTFAVPKVSILDFTTNKVNWLKKSKM